MSFSPRPGSGNVGHAMEALYCGTGLVNRRFDQVQALVEVGMAHRKPARLCGLRKSDCVAVPFAVPAMLALLCLAAARPVHAQAAVEYSGATGVSAGTTASRPGLFSPGGGRPNSSRTLAKPVGPSAGKINRDWFAKQAGRRGGRLSINAIPPRTRVWIGGKYVGRTPVSVTLPAGKYHLSLMGPRQEHAGRDVKIASGKNQSLEIHLEETYPQTVSVVVFGKKKR